MNHLKSLLAIALLMVGGAVFGATETLSCTAGTIVSNIMTFTTANFTFVHAKAADANFASYTPWRVYTNNTVTITGGSGVQTISSITIYTSSSAYATAVNGSIVVTGGGTASALVSGNNCTITITGTATAVVIDPTAQTRWSSIDVNYVAAAVSCTAATTSFTAASVSKISNEAPFTNAFTSNNTSTKVWSSSNDAVATVDASGLVTLHAAGSANILVNQVIDGTYCAVVNASYALTVAAPPSPEPTNHATALSASTNTATDITVLWTDAVGGQLPQGYLVKASPTTLSAPVNGVAEANTTLVKNITPGTQLGVFTGLSASTTYNFSIWPYTNSGADINFKTDGVAPIDSAKTVFVMAAPVATDATDVTHLSSNNSFTANWQAATGATGYILDVYKQTYSGTATETESFGGITPNGNLIASATYLSGWTVNSQSSSRQIYTTTGNYGIASPSFAFTTTGDYILTKKYATNVVSVSFWAKQQAGATSSTLIEGFNGTSVETLGALSNADVSTAGAKTYNLTALGKNNINQIRLNYTKVLGNLSIDDIAITYVTGYAFVPVSGSPFTVNRGDILSKSVTGLDAGMYYYTVKATDGVFTTSASNQKGAMVDLVTSISDPSVSAKIYVANGQLIVSDAIDYSVYNAQGVKVANVKSASTKAPIALRPGVYMVKVVGKTQKVMIK